MNYLPLSCPVCCLLPYETSLHFSTTSKGPVQDSWSFQTKPGTLTSTKFPFLKLLYLAFLSYPHFLSSATSIFLATAESRRSSNLSSKSLVHVDNLNRLPTIPAAGRNKIMPMDGDIPMSEWCANLMPEVAVGPNPCCLVEYGNQ